MCRRLGVAVTCRGAGTSIAGNAVGSGVVIDFSRHLNRVLAVDPEARTASVEPGAILDSVTAAARRTRAAIRPRPIDPRPSHDRRQSSATTPAARGRWPTDAPPTTSSTLDVLTAAGVRFTARRYGRDGFPRADSPNVPDARGARRHRARSPRHDPHRVRPVRPAGFGLLARTPAARARLRRGPVPGRHRGHARRGHPGAPCGSSAPAAVALVVLGYPDMASAAEAVPALLPHRPLALEGLDARWSRWSRAAAGAAARARRLPRGGGWLFVETRREHAGRGARPRRSGSIGGCRRARRALIVTGPAAAALWRIREDGAGLGGRTPAGAPAWPGWEDAAVPPEQLGAYLREFEALLARTRSTALAYGHFGDGCVHARIDFPLRSATGAVARRSSTTRRSWSAAHGGSMSGEHGDGRARGELLPIMYSPAAIATFAAVKHIFDPANLLNPGVHRRPGPARRRPARCQRRRPLRAPRPSPTRTTAATCRPPCTGASASASAAPTPPPPAASCARPTWPPATRRTPPAGRARVLQEMANGALVTRLAGARGARGARPVPVLQGLRVGLPGRRRHGHLQGRGAAPALPAPAASAVALRAGLAAALGAARSRAPRLANATLRGPALAALAKRLGGIDARRPLPAVRPATFRAVVRRPPGRRRRPGRCCGWTRSPTTSPPRSARPPCGCWSTPATRCASPRRRCAAG